MKMTLEKLRNMDESEMADADHPFKKDITAEEFVEILNETKYLSTDSCCQIISIDILSCYCYCFHQSRIFVAS
jgi:hypothetical protein